MEIRNELRSTRGASMVYRVEEWMDAPFAKSVVHIGGNEKSDERIDILLIGHNQCPPINEDDAMEPHALEPTRRNAILVLEKLFGYERLGSLVQVDLCVHRSSHKESGMDFSPDNFTNIETEIGRADYVVLAWGSKVEWRKAGELRVRLEQALLDNAEKCHAFGLNNDGSPVHPAARKKLEWVKLDDEKIRAACGA